MDSPLAHISLDSSGIWGMRKPVLACGRIHTCKWRETDTELISYAIAQIKMNVIISIKMKSIFEKRWNNDPRNQLSLRIVSPSWLNGKPNTRPHWLPKIEVNSNLNLPTTFRWLIVWGLHKYGFLKFWPFLQCILFA